LNFVVGVGAPSIRETRTSGWRFASADGCWVITLLPDNFSLETTAYTTWAEDFAPRLHALIDAVAVHVQPTIEQRLGLRYVDRIKELGLTELKAWEPYLHPHLLGLVLHPQLGPGIRNYQHQLTVELADGVLVGLRHGPVEDPEKGTVDYQLDFDVFRQGGKAFDAETIKSTADQFSVDALQLFQATVSDQLLDRLR